MPKNSAQFSLGYMTPEGKAYLGTILISVVLILVGIGFISEGPKHIPAFAAYAAGAVLILLVILAVISLVTKRRQVGRNLTVNSPAGGFRPSVKAPSLSLAATPQLY